MASTWEAELKTRRAVGMVLGLVLGGLGALTIAWLKPAPPAVTVAPRTPGYLAAPGSAVPVPATAPLDAGSDALACWDPPPAAEENTIDARVRRWRLLLQRVAPGAATEAGETAGDAAAAGTGAGAGVEAAPAAAASTATEPAAATD